MEDGEVKTSSDAYRLIHGALGQWIYLWIVDGGFSNAETDARKLLTLADLMREIETRLDGK